MTFWAWAGIVFGAVALVETVFVLAFAGIPLLKAKRKERRSRV